MQFIDPKVKALFYNLNKDMNQTYVDNMYTKILSAGDQQQAAAFTMQLFRVGDVDAENDSPYSIAYKKNAYTNLMKNCWEKSEEGSGRNRKRSNPGVIALSPKTDPIIQELAQEFDKFTPGLEWDNNG